MATDILATIDNAKERNIFFEKIALPYRLPRPSLQKAKHYLETIGPGITKALGQKAVKDAISISLKASDSQKALLKTLGSLAQDPQVTKQNALDKTVSSFKKKILGDDKLLDSLSVSDTSTDADHKEITLQVKLTADNYADILAGLGKLAKEDKNIKDMLDKL